MSVLVYYVRMRTPTLFSLLFSFTIGCSGGGNPTGLNGGDGADGSQGPPGPQGAQGPQGLQGPAGPEGPPGKDATAGSGYVDGSRLKWVPSLQKTASDGSISPPLGGKWFDTQLNDNCGYYSTFDGVGNTYCIPKSVGISIFRTDVNCTTPILSVTKGACAPPEKTALLNEVSGPACNQVVVSRIFSVGPKASPAKIYYMSNGVCIDASGSIPSYDFYSLGAEIPLSTYVSMPYP